MRRELFALHLPSPERVRADNAVLAELSKGLSGEDILNICLNAIYAESTDPNPKRRVVTQTTVAAEIAKARKAKAEHSGEEAGPEAEDWVLCGVIKGLIILKGLRWLEWK